MISKILVIWKYGSFIVALFGFEHYQNFENQFFKDEKTPVDFCTRVGFHADSHSVLNESISKSSGNVWIDSLIVWPSLSSVRTTAYHFNVLASSPIWRVCQELTISWSSSVNFISLNNCPSTERSCVVPITRSIWCSILILNIREIYDVYVKNENCDSFSCKILKSVTVGNGSCFIIKNFLLH